MYGTLMHMRRLLDDRGSEISFPLPFFLAIKTTKKTNELENLNFFNRSRPYPRIYLFFFLFII